MNRRHLLLSLVGVGAVGVALRVTKGDLPAPPPPPVGSVADEELPIPYSEMLNGLPKDAIRSITERRSAPTGPTSRSRTSPGPTASSSPNPA